MYVIINEVLTFFNWKFNILKMKYQVHKDVWLSLNSYSFLWRRENKNDTLDCAYGNVRSVQEYFYNFAVEGRKASKILITIVTRNLSLRSLNTWILSFFFTLFFSHIFARAVVKLAILFSARDRLPSFLRFPAKYIIQSAALCISHSAH